MHVRLVKVMLVLSTVAAPSGVRGGSGWYDDGYDYDYWDEPDYDYGYEYDDYEYNICSFTETPGYAIYGQSVRTMIDSTAEECKRACVDALGFTCRSLDFNTNSQSCFISDQTKDSANYGAHAHSVHYEMSCASAYMIGGSTQRPPAEGEYYRHTSLYHVPDTRRHYPGFHVFKDGHCYIQYGPIGYRIGIDHTPQLRMTDVANVAHGNITKVTFKCDWRRSTVGSIQMTYGDHPGELFFSELQREDEHVASLDPGEVITGIRGDFERELSNLELITNGRTLGPFCTLPQSYGETQFLVDGRGKTLAYMSGFVPSLSHDYRKYYNFFFHC